MIRKLPSSHVRPATWLALGWLTLLVGVALLAPLLPLPYQPATPDLVHVATPPDWAAPGPAHYLGTDALGRDVLAGLLAGARQLVLHTLPAVALATLVGALSGAAAGFWGNRQLRLPAAVAGWAVVLAWWALGFPTEVFYLLVVASFLFTLLSWRAARSTTRYHRRYTFALPFDSLVLGAATLLGAVPRLILLVVLAASPPPASGQFIGLLALLAWPEVARLVRGRMLWVRAQPFVEAARASGLPASRIWWHHALPHACRPLLAFAPLSLAGLVGLESSLAFLGIGQGPDVVSWGGQLSTVRQDLTAWWVAVFPGLALLLTLLALQKMAALAPKNAAK